MLSVDANQVSCVSFAKIYILILAFNVLFLCYISTFPILGKIILLLR